jgi:hypothetical protein
MQSFLTGSDVTLTFDLSITGLEPTGAYYRVLDEDDAVLVDSTELALSGTEVSVTVPQELNELGPQRWTAARLIEVTVISVAGNSLLTDSYRLFRPQRLVTPFNSFQSLLGANLRAHDLLDMLPWHDASAEQQLSALQEAHARIERLRFYYVPEAWQSKLAHTVDVRDLSLLTVSEWNALDGDFREALQRAQVLEAAELLRKAADPLAALERDGVRSITVGESSRVFNTSRAKSPLSPRAMRALGKYLAPAQVGRA